MSDIRYRSEAFNDIYLDITTVLQVLDENIDELNNVKVELDEMEGEAITSYGERVDEFIDAHDNLLYLLESTQQYMNNLKEEGDEAFKPINESSLMNLDVQNAKKIIKDVIDVVHESLQGTQLEDPNTTSWINKKHEELDDGGLEAILNPMDEFKQRNCEAKFRNNERIYKEAMQEYIQGISFEKELDDLNLHLRMYEELNADILSPMHDLDLYNGYLTATIGSTAASSVISMENKLEEDLKQLEHEQNMNKLHTTFDALSLVPVVGEFADAANAVIYLCEGDFINAGISALSLIPVAGSAFVIGKHGDDAVDIGKGITKVAREIPTKVNEADYLIDSFIKSPLGIVNSAVRGDVAGVITATLGMVTSSSSKFTDEILKALDIDALSVSKWVFNGINYIFN